MYDSHSARSVLCENWGIVGYQRRRGASGVFCSVRIKFNLNIKLRECWIFIKDISLYTDIIHKQDEGRFQDRFFRQGWKRYVKDKMTATEVQSVILNFSFPRTLEEVLEIQKGYREFDIEHLIRAQDQSDIIDSWSMPKWMKPGDIVFFMHTKTSKNTIARLRNQLRRDPSTFSAEDQKLIYEGLDHGKELYDNYGGKIFLIAQIAENPIRLNPEELDKSIHWKSRIYAYIYNNWPLDNPIDLSEFNSFIKLSCGGTHTPVYGGDFRKLRDIIRGKNKIPDYLENCIAMPIPLVEMNEENWLQVASKYRYSFQYESQFREFYVNYLLKAIGDRKTIYRECACKKGRNKDSFVDNVILFNGRYLPIEVKISINTEANLVGQIHKYCNLDTLYLDKRMNRMAPQSMVYRSNVLIIDTNAVFMYYDTDQSVKRLVDLQTLVYLSDLNKLRDAILTEIEKHYSG